MINQEPTGNILTNGRETYRIAYEDQRSFWAFGHVQGSKQIINITKENEATTSVEATSEFDYNGEVLIRIGYGFESYQKMIEYINDNNFIDVYNLLGNE